jgi:hypothetical protein
MKFLARLDLTLPAAIAMAVLFFLGGFVLGTLFS